MGNVTWAMSLISGCSWPRSSKCIDFADLKYVWPTSHYFLYFATSANDAESSLVGKKSHEKDVHCALRKYLFRKIYVCLKQYFCSTVLRPYKNCPKYRLDIIIKRGKSGVWIRAKKTYNNYSTQPLLIKWIVYDLCICARVIYIFIAIFNLVIDESWVFFQSTLKHSRSLTETPRSDCPSDRTKTFLRNSFFRTWKRYLRNNFDAIGNVWARFARAIRERDYVRGTDFTIANCQSARQSTS